MRCFFLRLGHIADVEVLSAATDAEAVEQAKALFELRGGRYDGFEVWELGRIIYRYHRGDSDGNFL
jgi:hypothetical protein